MRLTTARGRVRLRLVRRTDGATLRPHVEGLTQEEVRVYTDEWKGYNRVECERETVCHSAGEWARDDGQAFQSSGRSCSLRTVSAPH